MRFREDISTSIIKEILNNIRCLPIEKQNIIKKSLLAHQKRKIEPKVISKLRKSPSNSITESPKLKRPNRKSSSEDEPLDFLMGVDPMHFSSYLTFYDFELFSKITTRELMEKERPNASIFIKRFDKVFTFFLL